MKDISKLLRDNMGFIVSDKVIEELDQSVHDDVNRALYDNLLLSLHTLAGNLADPIDDVLEKYPYFKTPHLT